ncbi:kinesin [Diaporthe helianthi]|uniref:Kinesin-like protein n=1 Tax=Diaporthe helianthi TaxID=158607 RepID=A0A2P5HJZ3_DIAHE|nr:kinesin [Diaporthe helianthi]
MEERTESAVCMNPDCYPSHALLAFTKLTSPLLLHQQMRASQLRPPGSRLPAPNVRPPTLNEMSESQNNVRAQPSMLPQAGVKRPQSNSVSQSLPDAKARKTLAERAGEFPGKTTAATTPAPRTANKGVSLAAQTGLLRVVTSSWYHVRLDDTHVIDGGPPELDDLCIVEQHDLAGFRGTIELRYETEMKPPSTGPSTGMPLSRHQSSKSMSSRLPASSFAQSVGPNIGRSNSMIGRSKTSMSFHRSTDTSQGPNATRTRPKTAMTTHPVVEDEAPNGKQSSWDMDDRLVEMEAQFKAMKDVMNVSLTDKKAMEEVIEMAKTRASDLERERNRLDEKNTGLQSELDSMRQQVQSLTLDLEQVRRSKTYELEIKDRDHISELEQFHRTVEDQTNRLSRQHQEELDALKRQYRVEMEDGKLQAAREVEELRSRLGSEQDGLTQALHVKDREIQDTRAEMDILKSDLEREQTQRTHLRKQMDGLISTNTTLEGTVRTLQAQVHFLESGSKQQSDAFTEMEGRMQQALVAADEARQKLIKEETERRALFNKYQELKGNIRVMCRVRPLLEESEGTAAELDFPDDKTSAQIYVKGPEEKNALGKTSTKTYPFEFDRVFTPQIHNEEIFGEISQLVQSALDGYNVCIFCYGQTGSGKTYTMSSPDGMIPRATKMIYDTVNKLKEKSWTYAMEGNFVEVYNEELHDLLTPAREAEGRRKPEIRHDEARKTTTVLNCKSVTLDSEDTVEQMLKHAQNNRSVAATKANERSSRSHSVFILKLIGENSATHERCEGTLNLVDLAGSERLKHSGAEGDRMKETQNINKSLTCLGDVIEALGKGSGHIPYRNSQLTYLLKNSLGGNSKTLMFVMVSPLEAHLKETLTSLRFATKVHNTHIGTAKATKKTKDRISDS